MMRRAAMAVAAMVGLCAAAGAQETTDKQQLHYAWKKGDRFTLVSKYSMSVKLDKVPEVLQGVLSDEPAALKLEASLDVEVKEVAENGTATLEGQWKTLTAKGHVMVNDVDFAHDASRKAPEKTDKKPDAAPQDALPGLPNLEDTFRAAVAQPLKLQVDRRGRMKIESGGKSREGMDWLFYSMNGLMGSLPAEKVGKGDKWKDEFKPSLPGAGAILDVKSAVESAIVGEENSCLVIQSKFTVGGGAEKKDDPALAFKMKASGEGEGKTLFDAKAGRLSKCQHTLKSRVEAEIPNPGGGDAIDLKATVKIEQSNEIGK